MPESLVELADRMFVGPVWPASILVCLMVAYTLLALIGLIDLGFDPPDLDLDPGIDLDPGLDMDVPVDGVGLDVADGAGVDFLAWNWCQQYSGYEFWACAACVVGWDFYGRLLVRVLWIVAYI